MIPLTKDTFYVDNAAVELFTTCPWLAFASIIRRRRPAADSSPLRFGGFIHSALAYRYRMLHYRGTLGEREEMATIRLLENRFTNTPLETEGWRSLPNAIKAMQGYHKWWANESSELKVDVNPLTGFPYVEQPFAVDTHHVIRGRKIIYIGKIDLCVYESDRTRYILDHKTTSRLGDQFWEEQQMTGQHKGYIWADRECTGEECTGYIVNAIGVRESIENAVFDSDLGVVPIGAKSKAVPLELSRQRYFTRVPSGQIDEWFENMLGQVDHFLYLVDECDNDWRKWARHHHWCQCIRKYGRCQMYNVCSLPAASREAALNSGEFTLNEWTPLYG